MSFTCRFVPRSVRPAPASLLSGCLLSVCLLAVSLLAVSLQPVLAGSALAATSEACLRRCLSACPTLDKDGGENCLRPCLRDCPVHCGTVDTDCAVACLKRTPAVPAVENSGPIGEPWEATSKRSPAALRVSGCAEACTVKPDCRPMSYDSGPAELSGAARAPHARQSAPEHEKRFEPKGRSFSLVAPQGWTMQEHDNLAQGGDYELLYLAKGAALLDYTQISVRYVPGPHRTAERFRYDLEHPVHVAPNATAPVMAPISGGSSPAQGAPSALPIWSAESRSERTLIGQEDSVPVLKRTLLLPQTAGYFVLTLVAPQATAEAKIQVFERLAGSFRPQLKASARGPELSVHERAVWAGFFSSEGKVELAGRQDKGADKGAPPQFDPGLGQPMQYLADTAKTRLVAGRTLVAPGIHKDSLAGLLRGCGGQGTDKDLAAQALELSQAWDAVRGQQVLVTDEIFLPGTGEYGLKVQEEPKSDKGGAAQPEVMGGPARQGRMSRPSERAGITMDSSLALLSRVAFSTGGDLALAYVAHRHTSPGTSHFLLLRRAGGSAGGDWTLCGAAQKDMIIY